MALRWWRGRYFVKKELLYLNIFQRIRSSLVNSWVLMVKYNTCSRDTTIQITSCKVRINSSCSGTFVEGVIWMFSLWVPETPMVHYWGRTTKYTIPHIPMPLFMTYLFFFLWRFLRNLFLRLWVAILCLLRFLPQGITYSLLYMIKNLINEFTT